MFSVGVIYGVLGCLALTNAQYYNQDDYYRQFPQYTQTKSNEYHGYSTPPGINTNANSVQVIEVSIPSLPNLAGAFGISKTDEKVLSGVINQYLSASQGGTPYTFSIHAYNDKKSPQSHAQNFYGTHATGNAQSQYNPPNYQQPNYYQQSSYDYNNYNHKQQQHQREVEIYEQKLREYYAKYPWAATQPAATTASPQSELVKPNEITPSNPEPIPEDGKSLADLLLDNQGTTEKPSQKTSPRPNSQPSDGKSLLDLLNEEKGITKEPSEEHQTKSTTKKTLDDLIGNVFTDKPDSAVKEPPKQEGGKSLFELLAELPPVEEPLDEVKTKSDVAGGDYGLDVRVDDSKVKRTKRHILRDGIRRITERISNFGKSDNERHTRDHDCNHHEGRSHHSYDHHKHHNREDESDNGNGFIENHRHDKHKGEHPTDFENGGHGHEHSFYPHSHPYPHQHPHPHTHKHPHPNPNSDYDQHEEDKIHQNGKPHLTTDSETPFNQDASHDQVIPTSRKPHSVDAGTQTDAVAPKNVEDKDPTLDIDIRGAFDETIRKRRSADDEGFVFQDDGETPASKVEVKTDDQPKKEETEAEAEPADENTTEKDGEEGGLDNRFGLFGGFNRHPGRRPIANVIGGVVNGFLGGAVGGGYDPYNRGPPPQPYYPDPYGQQQYYPQQQQPVHIHINNVANANAQSQTTNTGPGSFGSNQNAAANAQSENYQNQFGSFQNAGAAGQASNLAADGSSGQLSAANAMNQNYQNEFGSGSRNQAQGQAANFDNHGNLALTSSNSGTNHFVGPDGVHDETNSAAQSSLQGQFGSQNSGAQSNTFQGPNGSGASASSQASSINNGFGHGGQNSGANAAANSGNIGGNSFGNAQSNTYANDQWGW